MFKSKVKRKLFSIASLILLISIPVFSFSIKDINEGVSYLPNKYISSHQSVITFSLENNTPTSQLQNIDISKGQEDQELLNQSEQEVTGESKYRVMEVAAINGDIQLLDEVLPLVQDIDSPLVPKYSTMMMAAAKNHQINFIEQLLHYGADINITTEFGYNALVAAVKSRNLETIRFLLENGAEVQKFQGLSVMAYAVATGDAQVVELLQSFGASYLDKSDISPMVIAVLQQNTELFNDILDTDININQQDLFTGRTPLLAAVSVKDRQMVKAILDKGTEVGLSDRYGNAALHYGAKRGDVEVLELLIAGGADVNQINRLSGESAVIIAAKNENCEIVEILITMGADVEQPDYQGKVVSDYLDINAVCTGNSL